VRHSRPGRQQADPAQEHQAFHEQAHHRLRISAAHSTGIVVPPERVQDIDTPGDRAGAEEKVAAPARGGRGGR